MGRLSAPTDMENHPHRGGAHAAGGGTAGPPWSVTPERHIGLSTLSGMDLPIPGGSRVASREVDFHGRTGTSTIPMVERDVPLHHSGGRGIWAGPAGQPGNDAGDVRVAGAGSAAPGDCGERIRGIWHTGHPRTGIATEIRPRASPADVL